MSSRQQFGSEFSKGHNGIFAVAHNCPIQCAVAFDIRILQDAGELCSWEKSSAGVDGRGGCEEIISRLRDTAPYGFTGRTIYISIGRNLLTPQMWNLRYQIR